MKSSPLSKEKNQRVLVGMSGGVDSSVAALLLCAAGYEVAGITMRLKPRALLTDAQAAAMEREVADAAAVCAKLGIPHFAPDFSETFSAQVIDAFVESYKHGETPNPCFRCNQRIKFGVLLDWALAHGFDKIATGHYAEIVEENGRTLLKRAQDRKDQSYFLSGLTPAQLSRTLLPLNRMGKAEARALAQEHGLPVAQKPDSQEICFVPDNDYAAFLEKFGGDLPGEGDFIAPDGTVLGRHKGIYRYTVGQRKGLGIALGAPRFVTEIDAARNTVTLGCDADRYTSLVRLRELNWIAVDAVEQPLWVEAKIRYAAQADRAWLTPTGGGTAQLQFETPQRAVTPGQVAALYQGDYVLGSGIITR